MSRPRFSTSSTTMLLRVRQPSAVDIDMHGTRVRDDQVERDRDLTESFEELIDQIGVVHVEEDRRPAREPTIGRSARVRHASGNATGPVRVPRTAHAAKSAARAGRPENAAGLTTRRHGAPAYGGSRGTRHARIGRGPALSRRASASRRAASSATEGPSTSDHSRRDGESASELGRYHVAVRRDVGFVNSSPLHERESRDPGGPASRDRRILARREPDLRHGKATSARTVRVAAGGRARLIAPDHVVTSMPPPRHLARTPEWRLTQGRPAKPEAVALEVMFELRRSRSSPTRRHGCFEIAMQTVDRGERSQEAVIHAAGPCRP